MKELEGFQFRSNLSLVVRERGKIVMLREGHNIWVNRGRAWLASLLSYSSFDPDVLEENNRLSYIGFGIGGNRQSALAVANSAPTVTHYPGTNLQNDIAKSATSLERPVRFTSPIPGAPVVPPYDPGDVWLKQVQLPMAHPQTTTTKLTLTVATTDISYGPFLTMPLSEIGLYHRGADINDPDNTLVAYDTFDTVPKTAAYDISVTWSIRF